MIKKILILILVFSVFVVGLCFGVNTYAWDESDNYVGSPIANGSEFINMSLTFPPQSYSGEYWFGNVSGDFCSLDYSFYSSTNNIESHTDRSYSLGVFETYDNNGDPLGKYFGLIDSNDGYSSDARLLFDVYYYDSNNDKVMINYSNFYDINSGSDIYYYPMLDLVNFTGLNITESKSYYIEYNGNYFYDDEQEDILLYFTDPIVNNLSSKPNFVYQNEQMLYLSSFNYFGPMGTQIGDVISDTFSLGTGILGAIASYFNVFALTDGNLSWIAVFGFALLGISLCIGMTRWISSLIRRKI